MASGANFRITDRSISRLREQARHAVRAVHPEETPSDQNYRVEGVVKNALARVQGMLKDLKEGEQISLSSEVEDLTGREGVTTYAIELNILRRQNRGIIDTVTLSKYDPSDAMAEPSSPESVSEEYLLSNVLTVQNVPFVLSRETLAGMRGERDAVHNIDPEILTTALRKKLFALKAQRETPDLKQSEFDCYFLHGQRVLNVLIRIYPTQEYPFIVHTAYYMQDVAVKERFHLKTTTAYNAWVSQLPQIGVPRGRSTSSHEKKD